MVLVRRMKTLSDEQLHAIINKPDMDKTTYDIMNLICEVLLASHVVS